MATPAWERTVARLVDERGDSLTRYAWLLCGDRDDAADLVQDALVKTFGRLGNGFTVPAAEAYVRRAILTTFLDGGRRRTRWRRIAHLTAVPEAVVGQEILSEAFPAGSSSPAIVVVRTAAVDEVVSAAEDVEGVVSATPGASDSTFTRVDVVLDVIGGEETDRNLKAVRTDATIVQVGLMGGANASVNVGLILSKRVTWIGTICRAKTPMNSQFLAPSLVGRMAFSTRLLSISTCPSLR